MGTTTATMESDNKSSPIPTSPQQSPATAVNLTESPETLSNAHHLLLKGAPLSTTESPTQVSMNSPNWGSNFKITAGYKGPNNVGLRPGSKAGVEGRSDTSPLLDHLILNPILGVMKRSELLSQQSPPPPSASTTQDTQNTHAPTQATAHGLCTVRAPSE